MRSLLEPRFTAPVSWLSGHLIRRQIRGLGPHWNPGRDDETHDLYDSARNDPHPLKM